MELTVLLYFCKLGLYVLVCKAVSLLSSSFPTEENNGFVLREKEQMNFSLIPIISFNSVTFKKFCFL